MTAPQIATAGWAVPSRLVRARDVLAFEWAKLRSVRSNYWTLLIAAVVFGYAQQIGTRLLDNYADKLLDEVRPLPRPGDPETRQV